MMWDSPLHAVGMFYYHWLIKKLIWLMADRIELGGKTKLNAGRKKANPRRHHPATKETRHVENEVTPRPCSNT